MFKKALDLSGKRFGMLTVLCRVGSAKNGDALWLCECDCGNQRVFRSSNIVYHNKSCGCINKKRCIERNTKGGFYVENKRIAQIYKDMIQRCYNKNCKAYRWYGEKGVGVCPEWLSNERSFFDFCYENGYSDDLTIDRIDSLGDYSPENCRFITRELNARRGVFKREYGRDGTDEEVIKAYE